MQCSAPLVLHYEVSSNVSIRARAIATASCACKRLAIRAAFSWQHGFPNTFVNGGREPPLCEVVSCNDCCDSKGSCPRGHPRLIPVPGHQHHRDAVIQRFGHDAMPAWLTRSPLRLSTAEWARTVANPGTRDGAELVGTPRGLTRRGQDGQPRSGERSGPASFPLPGGSNSP